MTNRQDTTDPQFDRWLSRRLHEAYDGVLNEQLPADLASLVQRLRMQRSHHGAGSAIEDDGPLGRRAVCHADAGMALLACSSDGREHLGR